MAFNGVISSDKINDLFGVKDRVVLVTGAGGLGSACAHAFAVNGAKVAIANRGFAKAEAVAKSLTDEGYEAKAYALDVESQADCDKVIADIVADFGRLDILVHTAAVANYSQPIVNVSDENFNETLSINLVGSIHIMESASKEMLKHNYGRIVNIASIDGVSVNCIDGMSYGVSKAGLIQATKQYAVSLAEKGITVNAISPVWIWTPMMSHRPNDYMVQAAGTIPMGRVSYSEDYVGTVLFLCSEASAYITGQNFMVDGGWSVSRIFRYKNF